MKTDTITAPAEKTFYDRLDSFMTAVREALLLQIVTADLDLLTRQECINRAKCSRSHFYRHIEPQLHRLSGRPRRYTRASLEDYLRRELIDGHGQPLYKREAKRRTTKL